MNRDPQTKQLEATQFKPVGDRPMGKIIGTRYPVEVQQALEQLGNHQAFIRAAVEEKLRETGKILPNDVT